MREVVGIVSGIRVVADGLVDEFKRLLPWQRKTQRGNLALLVATMLEVRSANLMDLAAALPREADRTDMRYQWIARVLGNDLIDPDAVMAPFAAEVLGRAAADRRGIVLILDQSKVSDRHQVLMLAVRHGARVLPLAWRSKPPRARSASTRRRPCSMRFRPGCRRAGTIGNFVFGRRVEH